MHSPSVPSPAAPWRTLCRGCETRVLHALGAETFGHEESKLKRLVGIQSGIAMRVVAPRQILFRDRLRAAQAFGDILARHFEMHAAGVRAFGAMNLEEGFHLFEDALERACLETCL